MGGGPSVTMIGHVRSISDMSSKPEVLPPRVGRFLDDRLECDEGGVVLCVSAKAIWTGLARMYDCRSLDGCNPRAWTMRRQRAAAAGVEGRACEYVQFRLVQPAMELKPAHTCVLRTMSPGVPSVIGVDGGNRGEYLSELVEESSRVRERPRSPLCSWNTPESLVLRRRRDPCSYQQLTLPTSRVVIRLRTYLPSI